MMAPAKEPKRLIESKKLDYSVRDKTINTKHCLESHMTTSSKLCSDMFGYRGTH